MKRIFISALALLGMGTMATEADAQQQIYLVKDGKVVYSGDMPEYVTFEKPDLSGEKPQLPAGEYNGHEYVDLGLPSGTLWAKMNVGATTISDYGLYFAWGEVTPKENYSFENYAFYKAEEPVSSVDGDGFEKEINNSGYTKYVMEHDAKTNGHNKAWDDKTSLDLADDAANVNWGGSWRMPTADEWAELSNNCTYDWLKLNGVIGRKVTGPNGNYIFLPAAGCRSYGYHYYHGCYWSSSLDEDCSGHGRSLEFGEGDFFNPWSDDDRYLGLSVRPVCPSAE